MIFLQMLVCGAKYMPLFFLTIHSYHITSLESKKTSFFFSFSWWSLFHCKLLTGQIKFYELKARKKKLTEEQKKREQRKKIILPFLLVVRIFFFFTIKSFSFSLHHQICFLSFHLYVSLCTLCWDHWIL